MRTPISLVRSETAMSMMFMMKMPLIASVMAAITKSTTVKASEMFFAASSTPARLSTR